ERWTAVVGVDQEVSGERSDDVVEQCVPHVGPGSERQSLRAVAGALGNGGNRRVYGRQGGAQLVQHRFLGPRLQQPAVMVGLIESHKVGPFLRSHSNHLKRAITIYPALPPDPHALAASASG